MPKYRKYRKSYKFPITRAAKVHQPLVSTPCPSSKASKVENVKRCSKAYLHSFHSKVATLNFRVFFLSREVVTVVTIKRGKDGKRKQRWRRICVFSLLLQRRLKFPFPSLSKHRSCCCDIGYISLEATKSTFPSKPIPRFNH